MLKTACSLRFCSQQNSFFATLLHTEWPQLYRFFASASYLLLGFCIINKSGW